MLTTPTKQYHGRTSIRPSSPPVTSVFAHTQVWDPRESACCWPALGTHLPGHQPPSSHQTFLSEVELRQCVFCKEPLSFWFESRLRNFGLLGSEYKCCASWILMPLSQDVPNLSPEKCVRVQALLCPLDYLWTPPTIQEDLANGRPHLDCHPSFFIFVLGFLRMIRTTFVGLVRHFTHGLILLTIPDVDDELLPELVDNPGTTRGTKLSVLHTIVFPSLVNRGLWQLTHS